MSKPNLIFLLIDNLRFDSFSDKEFSKCMFPNFSLLIEEGFICRVTTNGHATKFAMPSIFTQTYPLDYGGYNDVVVNRPKTFVEVLKDSGYESWMLQADDNDGPVSMCERGFDHVEAIYDMRLLLQNYIEEVLIYEVNLWKKGEYSDEEISNILKNKFGAVLNHIGESIHRVERKGLPKQLRKVSPMWSKKFKNEIKLLNNDPLLVANKIITILPHFYYLCLGRKEAGGWRFHIGKNIYRVVGRLLSFFTKHGLFPFRILTSRKSPLAEEVLGTAHEVIKNKKAPWFIYAHLMDLHDRRLLNRPIHLFKKLMYWPKWFINKKNNNTFERFQYDVALKYLDKELANLIQTIKSYDSLLNTRIIITGDHGCEMEDAAFRGNSEVFGFRAHPEHINVPFIYSSTERKPMNNGLLDSMSISATILDDLGIEAHPSFKGCSAFKVTRPVVISENCGRGNGDIKRKDLYFTVTTQAYKMMAKLIDKKLSVVRFYDLKKDPRELKNIISDSDVFAEIQMMLDHLFSERGELLSDRGSCRDQVVFE